MKKKEKKEYVRSAASAQVITNKLLTFSLCQRSYA